MAFSIKILALAVSVAVFSAASSLAQSNGTISKQNVSFAVSTKVLVHSPIKLRGAVQDGFRKLQTTGGVYGAMYVTQDGAKFSWRSRRFSVQDAMKAAQVDCEAFHQQKCVLYATLVPASAKTGQIFIPDQTRDTWEEVLRETRPGNHIAIAANKSGASGFAWDFSSRSKARAAALRTCNNNTVAQDKETDARVLSANRAADIYKCRIFYTLR